MITIFLNDKKQTIPAELNLYDFLMQNKLLKEYSAVTVNNILVLRNDLRETFLHSNYCVDFFITMHGVCGLSLF